MPRTPRLGNQGRHQIQLQTRIRAVDEQQLRPLEGRGAFGGVQHRAAGRFEHRIGDHGDQAPSLKLRPRPQQKRGHRPRRSGVARAAGQQGAAMVQGQNCSVGGSGGVQVGHGADVIPEAAYGEFFSQIIHSVWTQLRVWVGSSAALIVAKIERFATI